GCAGIDAMRKIDVYLPAIVAAAKGLLVAVTVYTNQPGRYPMRLLAIQLFIVGAALLFVFQNRWIQLAAFLLLFVGIILSFSVMFLYLPTFLMGVRVIERMEVKPASGETRGTKRRPN